MKVYASISITHERHHGISRFTAIRLNASCTQWYPSAWDIIGKWTFDTWTLFSYTELRWTWPASWWPLKVRIWGVTSQERSLASFPGFEKSYNPYVQVMRMYQVSWEGRVCAGTAPSPVRSVRQITPSAQCAPDSSLVSTAAISHTTTTWKVKWYLVKHAEYYSFYSAVWFLPSTVMVRPCWLR